MRFQDPASVECPACGQASEQSVRSLLRLEASCPHCRAGFQEEGRKLRELMEDVTFHSKKLEILVELEDVLGVTFDLDADSDRELHAARTVRELVAFFRCCIQEPSDDQLEKAVRVAIVGSCRQAVIDMDAPFLDALCPDRWNGDDAWWINYR